MKLFGTDGIRGQFGEYPMTLGFFLELGLAVGHLFASDKEQVSIIIGRDTRASSFPLQSALVAGLLASGVNVYDVGVISTPGVAWLVRHLKMSLGAVISASHNPYYQNGIKFFDVTGEKLPAKYEEQIELWMANGSARSHSEGGPFGQYHKSSEMVELYILSLLGEHSPLFLSGMRILVDGANGAASNIAPELFTRAGADVFAINVSPDGKNINVNAGSEHVRSDPSAYQQLIKQSQADIVIAFDGDADRVIFVSNDGLLIDGDHTIGILARYLLQNDQLFDNSVVVTNMRNQGLFKYLQSLNISVYETQVGDKYVVEKLQNLGEGASYRGEKFGLGGEQSGHIILLDEMHSTGDGMRTALFVLVALKAFRTSSLGQLASEIGKTPQVIASAFVGTNLNRFTKEALKEKENDTISRNPGMVRVSLRYSGTEPKYRVMLESDGTIDEVSLARISLALCKEAQNYAGINSDDIEILNVAQGGFIHLDSVSES